MAMHSRRSNVKRIEIAPQSGKGETISVTIRGLRGTEETWARGEINLAAYDENYITEQTLIRYARIGLTEVHDVTDVDTGRPFELKFTNVKIFERSAQVVDLPSVDALADYIMTIGGEVAKFTHLTDEEKQAIPFTGPSPTRGALTLVPNAPTEASGDAKPSA
jgi:hypothetical protein